MPDYVIVNPSAPSGRALATAAEAVRNYLGDPRDWPVGAESALRADLLFAAAEAVIDAELADRRFVTKGELDKAIEQYEERIRVGRQENELQRARIDEVLKAVAGVKEALAETVRRNGLLGTQLDEANRLIQHLRSSEEELSKRLGEIAGEAQGRRDGYFKHVEKIEREKEELYQKNVELSDRLKAFEALEGDPAEATLAKARLDLAERLAVWLDTNPLNKGGPYERGFEKAIDLLKDLTELPAVDEDESQGRASSFEILDGGESR